MKVDLKLEKSLLKLKIQFLEEGHIGSSDHQEWNKKRVIGSRKVGQKSILLST